MTVTIWNTLANDGAGAIATRTDIIGWTEPEGDESPEPIYGDPVPLERLTAAKWTRPQWSGGMRADPASYGASNFQAGESILDVVDVKPSLGEFDRLGAMGAGVPDLDAGTMTYTWAKVSADAFDAATHHAPVWTGSAWAAPVAKSLAELKAAKVAAIKGIGPVKIAEGFKYTVPGSGVQHTYQVDLESQSHMMAVFAEHLDNVSSPHGGYWRSRANVNVTMTDAQNKAFLRAAKSYKMAIIRRAQTLIDAAVAAADAPALALVDPVAGTIDGAGGWPANG